MMTLSVTKLCHYAKMSHFIDMLSVIVLSVMAPCWLTDTRRNGQLPKSQLAQIQPISFGYLMFNGLYYKHITILNDASRVVST